MCNDPTLALYGNAACFAPFLCTRISALEYFTWRPLWEAPCFRGYKRPANTLEVYWQATRAHAGPKQIQYIVTIHYYIHAQVCLSCYLLNLSWTSSICSIFVSCTHSMDLRKSFSVHHIHLFNSILRGGDLNSPFKNVNYCRCTVFYCTSNSYQHWKAWFDKLWKLKHNLINCIIFVGSFNCQYMKNCNVWLFTMPWTGMMSDSKKFTQTFGIS